MGEAGKLRPEPCILNIAHCAVPRLGTHSYGLSSPLAQQSHALCFSSLQPESMSVTLCSMLLR